MARRYISRLRSRDDFRRKAGLRTPRSITLIVCEGETEQLYFQAARLHFGLTNAEVVIADNATDSAPISVVKLAEAKCREPGGYDKVFCVFDRDDHKSFSQARDRVTELRTRAENPLPIADAVSIPCFEVWVLLHFERSDAPFNRCADVVTRIKQKHIAGYKKTDETIARDLMTRLPTALANGVWLEAPHLMLQCEPRECARAICDFAKECRSLSS